MQTLALSIAIGTIDPDTDGTTSLTGLAHFRPTALLLFGGRLPFKLFFNRHHEVVFFDLSGLKGYHSRTNIGKGDDPCSHLSRQGPSILGFPANEIHRLALLEEITPIVHNGGLSRPCRFKIKDLGLAQLEKNGPRRLLRRERHQIETFQSPFPNKNVLGLQ